MNEINEILHKRTNWLTTIAGYAAKSICYASGDFNPDSTVNQSATLACNAFLDGFPLIAGVARIYRGAMVPDSNGKSSFLNYTMKLLKAGITPAAFMCSQAFVDFGANTCQGSSGAKTRGGNIEIDNSLLIMLLLIDSHILWIWSIKFSIVGADPQSGTNTAAPLGLNPTVAPLPPAATPFGTASK